MSDSARFRNCCCLEAVWVAEVGVYAESDKIGLRRPFRRIPPEEAAVHLICRVCQAFSVLLYCVSIMSGFLVRKLNVQGETFS